MESFHNAMHLGISEHEHGRCWVVYDEETVGHAQVEGCSVHVALYPSLQRDGLMGVFSIPEGTFVPGADC
jgi:hypothetical protein